MGIKHIQRIEKHMKENPKQVFSISELREIAESDWYTARESINYLLWSDKIIKTTREYNKREVEVFIWL